MPPLLRKKKHLFMFVLAALILTLVGITGIIVYQGKQLASPDRRELQSYHHDWLQEPEKHGISIQKTTQLDGKVPCLIVTPDPTAKLGDRGITLRKQLQDRGRQVSPHGQIVGNIVLLHGRNGRKEDLLPVAERFCAAGLRCIIPDLPAHGESPIPSVQFGSSDWERDFPHKLLLECSKTLHFSPTPSAIWGMSMGGSFATHSASTGAPWKCVVIVSSFDQLDHVLDKQSRISNISMAKNLLYYICESNGGAEVEKVTPAIWANSVTTPVLVAHGTDDSLIDLVHGKTLYDSFASPEKKWVEVDGGDHHNVLTTPMPLYATMADWVLKRLDDE